VESLKVSTVGQLSTFEIDAFAGAEGVADLLECEKGREGEVI
jgi:hypothetical protein